MKHGRFHQGWNRYSSGRPHERYPRTYSDERYMYHERNCVPFSPRESFYRYGNSFEHRSFVYNPYHYYNNAHDPKYPEYQRNYIHYRDRVGEHSRSYYTHESSYWSEEPIYSVRSHSVRQRDDSWKKPIKVQKIYKKINTLERYNKSGIYTPVSTLSNKSINNTPKSSRRHLKQDSNIDNFITISTSTTSSSNNSAHSSVVRKAKSKTCDEVKRLEDLPHQYDGNIYRLSDSDKTTRPFNQIKLIENTSRKTSSNGSRSRKVEKDINDLLSQENNDKISKVDVEVDLDIENIINNINNRNNNIEDINNYTNNKDNYNNIDINYNIKNNKNNNDLNNNKTINNSNGNKEYINVERIENVVEDEQEENNEDNNKEDNTNEENNKEKENEENEEEDIVIIRPRKRKGSLKRANRIIISGKNLLGKFVNKSLYKIEEINAVNINQNNIISLNEIKNINNINDINKINNINKINKILKIGNTQNTQNKIGNTQNTQNKIDTINIGNTQNKNIDNTNNNINNNDNNSINNNNDNNKEKENNKTNNENINGKNEIGKDDGGDTLLPSTDNEQGIVLRKSTRLQRISRTSSPRTQNDNTTNDKKELVQDCNKTEVVLGKRKYKRKIKGDNSLSDSMSLNKMMTRNAENFYQSQLKLAIEMSMKEIDNKENKNKEDNDNTDIKENNKEQRIEEIENKEKEKEDKEGEKENKQNDEDKDKEDNKNVIVPYNINNIMDVLSEIDTDIEDEEPKKKIQKTTQTSVQEKKIMNTGAKRGPKPKKKDKEDEDNKEKQEILNENKEENKDYREESREEEENENTDNKENKKEKEMNSNNMELVEKLQLNNPNGLMTTTEINEDTDEHTLNMLKLKSFEEYLSMTERFYCGRTLVDDFVNVFNNKLKVNGITNNKNTYTEENTEEKEKIKNNNQNNKENKNINKEQNKEIQKENKEEKTNEEYNKEKENKKVNGKQREGNEEVMKFNCSKLDLVYRVSFNILKSPLRQPETIDLWGPKELILFELGLFKYGKEFHEIQREIPSKSVKEIVDMYYLWKKTNRYKIWKANRYNQMKKNYT